MPQETTAERPLPPEVDTAVPHRARVYDHLLDGAANYEADRTAAQYVIMASPGVREGVQAHRAFLRRAVRYLAADVGVRQFIDIGAGLPTQGNTHEIAREVSGDARVVYVDNDPVVTAHARALLGEEATGVGYITGDLREPDAIRNDPVVREMIDFDRPVALLLTGVLHFVTDDEDPYDKVARLTSALPVGGHLVLSHATQDILPEATREAARSFDRSATPMTDRTYDETMRFFDGLELVEPGLVEVVDWRPDGESTVVPEGHARAYGAIGVRR